MSARLEDRLKELKGLPPLPPPEALERRTVAAMGAAAVSRRPRPRAYAALWIAAAGVTLAVALGVATLEPEPAVETLAEATPADSIYTELAAEAAYLEQVIAAMPQRSVMRVSTAGTIAGIEDQIALVDVELDRTQAPEHRTLLMHNRVQLMNALANVRYSQSTAFVF